jgi:fido (protein-threonine AMPylation protein)
MFDPYLDPSSGILKNNLGITSQEELNRQEARVVGVRAIFLELSPVVGSFDTNHLKAIHCYLFKDVYEWAGQFRTTTLAKTEFIGGGRVTRFAEPSAIETSLQQLFDSLAEDHNLQNLSRLEFVPKVSQLFAALNSIHPFREGNGRAMRHFIRQLAIRSGHKLDFSIVSKERIIRACVNSAKGDHGMIERMMDEISDPSRVEPVAKLINFFNAQGFEWNDQYLAVTVSGQGYSGVFASSDGRNFFFRDDADRILIGNTNDLPSGVRQGDKIQFTAS